MRGPRNRVSERSGPDFLLLWGERGRRGQQVGSGLWPCGPTAHCTCPVPVHFPGLTSFVRYDLGTYTIWGHFLRGEEGVSCVTESAGGRAMLRVPLSEKSGVCRAAEGLSLRVMCVLGGPVSQAGGID